MPMVSLILLTLLFYVFVPILFYTIIIFCSGLASLYLLDLLKATYNDGSPDDKLNEVMRTYH